MKKMKKLIVAVMMMAAMAFVLCSCGGGNADGTYVASCDFRVTNNMASIGLVFTLKDFRRKHYAENLVHQVTKEAAKLGYLPMLYTDADYTASNACYVKIGYILRGKLCTIG